MRVDGCGYVGYAPPPQFDPLLAKLICASNSSGTFASALDRTLRALDEFHVDGVPTTLAQLRAILRHPVVRDGDARTTLRAEERLEPDDTPAPPLALLQQQAGTRAGDRPAASPTPLPGVAVADDQQAVACPLAGAVVEVSVYEAPPVLAPNPHDPADRRDEALATLIPRKRTTTFDIRRAIALLADTDSFFEIGPLWGTDQVAGFARFNGHPVGVIASDSRHANGGALTADGCSKLTRHLDLCDLFHLPVVNLVDNPGFAVGLEHETRGTIRRGAEWMVAFAQTTVPLFTVIMRRSFGVAGNNYATPRSQPSIRVVWPAADVGGIPPEGGIEAAYKRQLAEAADPAALRAELMARIESARGPLGPLSKFQMEEMIDPRDTRRLICEWIPTAYRLVSQPARLVPRALQFRP